MNLGRDGDSILLRLRNAAIDRAYDVQRLRLEEP
jgi:hypothetical protein